MTRQQRNAGLIECASGRGEGCVKTTIWYEFTDKEDVQTLRDAADALEKNGYVKLMLPNVELGDPPAFGNGGSAGGKGVGGWNACNFTGVAGGSSDSYGAGGGGSSYQAVGATGSNGRASGSVMAGGGGGSAQSTNDLWIERAKALGKPVCVGGGGGAGLPGYGDWVFPDGHTERLPAGVTPKWPADTSVRDAILNNP